MREGAAAPAGEIEERERTAKETSKQREGQCSSDQNSDLGIEHTEKLRERWYTVGL